MTINRLLVSKKELRELGIPYCFAHIARLEAAGLFPKRVRLGACRVAWRYEQIVGWVKDREAGRLRDYVTGVS